MRLVRFVQRHPAVIAWLIGLSAVGISFELQERATEERKLQICEAEIEDRVLIRDIIDFAFGDAPASSETGEFQRYVHDRIEIPPAICEGTDISVRDVIRRQREGE